MVFVTHGSLFSGIGGFDLAAEWMGWENVFHCENNPFCQKILKYYWPDAKSYGDIKETDFTEWKGKVDIVSGGFPCQPYSQAGKRKGKEDDRHLWPEMLRAIREIQPSWVVGENVAGLLNWKGGMVLAEIKSDLESAGFEVFPPCILPACGKNADHIRNRLFMVAYSMQGRLQTCNCGLRQINGVSKKTPIEFTRNVIAQWSKGKRSTGKVFRDNGLSERLDNAAISFSKYREETIKSSGNAVVPQVVYEIFKAITCV